VAAAQVVSEDRRMVESAQSEEPRIIRWSRATVRPDLWLDPGDDPRETGTETADERSTLLDYLRRYRLTLQIKCDDLDAAQLASRSVPPSTMSLLGLIRHMAEVERSWFRRVMAGQDAPPMYYTADDPDGDFDGAVADPAVVADAWQKWREEVGQFLAIVANPERKDSLWHVGRGTSRRPGSSGCSTS
jgi:uncharacterized damage-inducible protein DinB